MKYLFSILFLSFLFIGKSQSLLKTWHYNVLSSNLTTQNECDIRAIKIDGDNNTLVVGWTWGSSEFHGSPSNFILQHMPGYGTSFLAKFDPFGNELWSLTVGGYLFSIDVDINNNIYVCGDGMGDLFVKKDNDSILISSLTDNHATVMKFDQNGNFLWSREFYNTISPPPYNITGTTRALNLEVTNNGEIVVTGLFMGNVDFEPIPGQTFLQTTNTTTFIAKLDASGNLIWVKGLLGDGNGGSRDRKIDSDSDNNIYITGTFWGTLDFDPGIGTDSIYSDTANVFIVKLDPSGDQIWSKTFGGVQDDIPTGLKIGNNDDLYLTGSFQDQVEFDTGSGSNIQTSNGQSDIFISKYDQNGNLLWLNTYGSIYNDLSFGFAFDDNEMIYLVGNFKDTVDFNNNSSLPILASTGWEDGYLQKLDSSGTVLELYQYKSPRPINSLKVEAHNNGVIVSGVYEDTLNINLSSGITNVIEQGISWDALFLAYYSYGFLSFSEGQKETDGVTIYPNPTNDKFNIELSNLTNSSIQVYSLLGELMLEKRDLYNQFEININHLQTGVYLIVINSDQGKFMKKLVKK